MTRIRRAAALAAPVVLAFSLTACGGGDGGGGGGNESAADAPTDASQEDFCGVFEDFENDADDIDDDDTDAQADALQDVAGELQDTGTPEDMPEDARAGFEVVVDTWSDISADDLGGEDLQELGISNDNAEQATAFIGYASQTCDLDS